jgi:membrane protease YdiL (CAAX protease family)
MLTGFLQSAVPAVQPAPLLPLRRISLRTIIWSFLLGVGLLGPGLLLVSWLPVAPLTAHQVLNIAQNLPQVVLASVVVGPLMEEVVFRGLIIQLGRRYLPLALPVVFSLLLFAVIHFPKGLAVVAVAAPLAAVFTWLALRSRSLWTGFICHATFNLTAFVSTAYFGIYEKYIAHPFGDVPVNFFRGSIPAGWLVLSAVLVVSAVAMLRREFARTASH